MTMEQFNCHICSVIDQVIQIKKILAEKYHYPVYMDHNNSSAALADLLFGNGKRYQDFIFLGISNGVGYIIRAGGATDLLPEELGEMNNQIQRYFVEDTRLGIPLLFATEAISGTL